MKDVLIVDNLEMLRAMSEPIRLRILQALSEAPQSTSQVARQLGQRPARLHHHMVEMLRTGLIAAVETRQKGNLVETYYEPVARLFRVDNSLFQRTAGPEALATFYQNVASTLDITAANLKADIDAGKVTEEQAASSLRLMMRGRMQPERAAELKERLRALVAEYATADDMEGDVPASITIVLYTHAPGESAANSRKQPQRSAKGRKSPAHSQEPDSSAKE